MATGLDLRARPLRRHRRADRRWRGWWPVRAGSTPPTSATRKTACSRRSTRRSPSASRPGLPVHISHLKADGKANWGRAAAALERIVAARNRGQVVTADQYPYVASSSKLGADGRPPLGHARRCGGVRPAGRYVRPRRPAPRGDPARARPARRRGRDPDRPLSADARPRGPRPRRHRRADEGTTPLDVVLDIQRHGGAQAISFGMSEPDVRADHAARLRRHGLRRLDPRARRRRPAAPPGLRDVSAQDPLRPRRA